MRFILVAVCVLATGYAALRFVPGPAPLSDGLFPGQHPLVFAHRGGMGLWPEHTLYAFRSALAAGTDVLEMDVRRSADRQIALPRRPPAKRFGSRSPARWASRIWPGRAERPSTSSSVSARFGS